MRQDRGCLTPAAYSVTVGSTTVVRAGGMPSDGNFKLLKKCHRHHNDVAILLIRSAFKLCNKINKEFSLNFIRCER